MAALGGLQPPMPLLVSAVPDRIGEGAKRLGHAGPGLRRREELRRAVDRPHPAELFLAHDEPLGQVHLVPEEHHRDVADLLADHLDPVVEVVKGVLAREVADRDHALGALEVRVPEQGPEPFLAHDVPYHHVERRGGALPHDVERLLRDLRADRGDVAVVELVLHEPLDEGGLADRDIPDEADLGLEMLLAGHRGRRHHAPPIERGLMYRADASIAPDNFYSSGSTFRAYRSFATRSARDWNAFSTLTPAFADVKWNGLSYARAAWTMSSSLIWTWSLRSILFPRNSIGILPVTL